KLARLAASLNNLSPLNTLQRGYAIVTSDTSDTSTVLTQTDQVQLGMVVNVQLFQGRLRSRVESIDP
ncbi:MAG TPA: hypothetical protein PLH12_08520, partial [Pseudomonadales bacterium]|nr:hypothetical protein [Pseudomonadales bacterium]